MENTPFPSQQSINSRYVNHLVFLFGIVYFAQGIAQSGGLISLPLNYYLKEVMQLNELGATNYLTILTIPWIIKPVYGLVSDFISLFGYRRKSWLLVLNVLTCIGYLWLAEIADGDQLILALLLTAIGTAASDVIIDALMVENGRKFNMIVQFQAVQWFWFYVAQIVTSILGGWLAEMADPDTGLRTAAIITMVAPAIIAILSWLIVKEEKTVMDLASLKATVAGLRETFRSRLLWATILFLVLWNFSPGFGIPIYYLMTDTLNFSQSFIGHVGAISSAGSILGAWLYGKYISNRSIDFQLVFSILTSALSTFSYLGAITPTPYSGLLFIALSFFFGITSMTALLAILTLAARACPEKAEGFTFAVLMSIVNGCAQLSTMMGSWMLVNWFEGYLPPLIILSGAATLFCLFLLPNFKAKEMIVVSQRT
ncbi:MFS transporter [Nitrosomonas communis]|uniref:BT1 family protein n=1 Tax=Nitrosomonas communis TaxID=44574 RepID=A0A1I4K5V8_9PROT|nr:MFS transporter [Nitrosomonas communis]SFL74130.1 BT1 family protein [Nitrosomonas communis]